MILEPPLAPGVKATLTCWFPGVPVTPVGAAGTVGIATPLDWLLGWLVPVLLVAVIVNVYVDPGVKVVNVIGLTVPLIVTPPGLAVTV